MTIFEAASALRAKKISARELTKACLSRIRAVDKKLNAFVSITEEEALRDSDVIDQRFARGEDLNQLAGIPVGLKDVFSTKGVATTACSRMLKGFVPPYDAPVVERLRAAGMVLVGKTNTDEFTCGGSTEWSYHGPTRNPWDLERVSGGSSGGSAAAVSTGECLYALGTDTGGSIRQPAAFCGITGLKVTYGRVPRSGVISMASSFDTIGPLTQDVRDAAFVLNVIAGAHHSDQTTPNVPVPDYTRVLGKSIAGMRIGVPEEFFGDELEEETRFSVCAAIAQLKKLGAKIQKVNLPLVKYGIAVYYVLTPSEVSANMARYDGIRYGRGPSKKPQSLYEYYTFARGEGFGEEMKRRIMVGTYALSAGYYDAYYKKAQQVRTLVIRDFDRVFQEVDALVSPTSPFTAFCIGEKKVNPLELYLADVYTVLVNVAGIPAISVPCGFTKKNLPIGLQFMAPQFQEERVLQAAYVYEQSTDWHTKRPKISCP